MAMRKEHRGIAEPRLDESRILFEALFLQCREFGPAAGLQRDIAEQFHCA
jgi:hypothetical protein